MAAIHLFLPRTYGWGRYEDLVPATQAHIIYGISFAIGFLLFWGGCLSVLTSVRRKEPGRLDCLILVGLAAFWGLYVFYQWHVPPPVPNPVQNLLSAAGAVIAFLYVAFLLTRPEAEAYRAKEKS
jgi:drug/metabolite transporter (DMT)-like permease